MWRAQSQCFKKLVCHIMSLSCDWEVTQLRIVQPHILFTVMFLTCLSGFTHLDMSISRFSTLWGWGNPPRYVVRFFRPFGEGLPPCHVPFAFFDVPWWRNPPRHVAFSFFDMLGWGDLLVASISYFRRAVVGKPSPSHRVDFIRRAGVGRPFSSRRFCIFDVPWWGNPLRHVAFTLFDILWWGNPPPSLF